MTELKNIPAVSPTSPATKVAPEEPGVLEGALDDIFGKEGDGIDQSKSGGELPVDETKSLPGTTGDTDWQTLAGQFQSNYDKTKAELNKVNTVVDSQYKPVVEFLTQVYEDEEVRQAFIHELAPDLIKTKDPHTFIQESLAKEFGSDYAPDDNEINKPGTKSWLYSKQAEKLLEKAFAESSSSPKALKDIRAERAQKMKEKETEAHVAKQDIINKLKWDESTYNQWLGWTGKIKPIELAQLWNRINKKATSNQFAPNLAGVPGGTHVMPNQIKHELDTMFGPN